MKNVLKKMLALVLALTLVAGLALTANAASHPVGPDGDEECEWSAWTSNGDGTHSRSCICNPPITQTENCSGGTATCTEAAVCSACNTAYGEPVGHKLTATNVKPHSMTVTCDNCDYSCNVSVGIEPGDLDDFLFSYTGDPITPIKITYSTEWIGKAPVITYENNVLSNSNATATAKAYFEDVAVELRNTFFITKKDITGATIDVTPISGAYTGKAHTKPMVTLTVNGKTLVEGTDYTSACDGNLTDVGTYQVQVTGTGHFTGTASATYTITKADLTNVSVTQTGALAYTGSAQTATVEAKATTVDNSTVTFTYSATADGTFTAELPAFTDIGTYTVYYKAEAANHNGANGKFTVTIGKAVNEWKVVPAIEGWSYGETPKTPVAEAKYGDYTVTYTGTTNAGVAYDSATAPTEAGTYKAIFTVAEGDDYGALTAEVDFIVDRAVVKPADITYTKPDLTYNGQNRANDILASIVAPVAVRVNFTNVDTGVDEFPINAGNYSFKVRVAEATDNYYFTGGEYMQNDAWVFTIKKADPAITWAETEFTYDGAEHGEATVALVNDETYTGTISYTYKKNSNTSSGLPANAGTYTVTASIAEQANYKAATASTTIVIKPKAVTPTLSVEPEYFRYSGKAHRPEAVVKINGEVLALEDNYKIDYINNIEVGVATLKITCLNTSNYIFDPVFVDYLILPNLSDLNGITPENVTSAYQPIIDAHQEDMDGVDTSTVSEDAQNAWNEIVEYLESLEAAIKEIQAAMQQIIDETAALPDHPTDDDLDKIDELLDLYDDIQDQLTDGEKADLADEVTKLETEKEHIRETAEKVDEFVEDMDDLMGKDLTYKDKETVVDLSDRVNELLNDPHLTQEDKSLLTDADQALDIILSAYRKAEEVEKLIDKLPKTAEPDDEDVRDAYKEAKKAYDDLDEGVKKLVNPKYLTKLEKLAKALMDYKIIKGNGRGWFSNIENLVNLSFTANGPYDKYTYVKIDGKELDTSYYFDAEGSTIITLKASYLKNLSHGKHTIDIGYEDGELSGEASGYFLVVLYSDSPATGDTTNLVLFGVLGLSSLLALAAMTVARKKRNV